MDEVFDFHYGVMALVPNGDMHDIVHFVGFENEPTDRDGRGVKEELAADPEFGLVGVEVEVLPAPLGIVNIYREKMGLPRLPE